MIFVCCYCLGSVSSSSEVWKRLRIRCLTVDQVIFYTMAGRPSLSAAFHDFVVYSCRSISSMVMADISIGAFYGLVPLLSMLSGSGRKNLVSSSFICFLWSVVAVLSALTSCGIFLKTVSSSVFRYWVAAFQMLLLSARNLFQHFFFCFRIVLWYCFAMFAAIISSSGILCSVCCSVQTRFLQYI